MILVNDASTDRTLQIAESFARKDARVKVFSQEKNAGVDHARFRGISEAHGAYLMFVDSDDTLPKDAVESLYDEAVRTGADVVEGGFTRIYDNLGLIKRSLLRSARVIDQPELFDDYFISFFGSADVSVSVWGKIIRRSLFDQARPTPSGMRMGEDLLVSMQLFPFIKRYAFIGKSVYNYRWGGVTSGAYNAAYYSELKKLYGLKKEAISRHNYPKALPGAKYEMCDITFAQCVQMLRFGKGLVATKEFIEREINSGFIDEISNGYESKNPKILLLRKHDAEGFLAMAQAEADRKKWIRKLVMSCQWLLNYI